MSRRSRRSNPNRGRDSLNIANLRLPLDVAFPRDLRPSLLPYEDRRTYNPSPVRPAAGFLRPRHRLILAKPVSKAPDVKRQRPFLLGGTKAPIIFRGPRGVVLCVRRARRKEVLHALRKNWTRDYISNH